MSDDSQRPIIVKRIKKGGHGHHGGAWKIAYADLVTAMMAFFLLMWLLGSTAKGDLQGIAEFFKSPLKVAIGGGSGAGDASSIIKGGGQDLSRTAGQVKRGDVASNKAINLTASRSNARLREMQMLNGLKDKITRAMSSHPKMAQFKNQILLDMTSDGLRIQIVDEQGRPMFQSGSAELEPYTVDILRTIAELLNEVPNKIALSGHTDSVPYPGGLKGYSNWELSADRANASRRELIAGGMDPLKVLKVTGLADAVPLDKTDPAKAINRRISIVVLNKETEENIVREAGALQQSTKAEAAPITAQDVTPDAGSH